MKEEDVVNFEVEDDKTIRRRQKELTMKCVFKMV
jgi:hypothetical protein